jgi:hypothetical protein
MKKMKCCEKGRWVNISKTCYDNLMVILKAGVSNLPFASTSKVALSKVGHLANVH